MPLASTPQEMGTDATAAAATTAAVATAAAAAASTPASTAAASSSMAAAGASPLSAAAMESVKRRGLQLSSEFTEFVSAMARKDSPNVHIPVELKLLAALVVLFLFLLFLIAVLWDRYGKEIGELYTPNGNASEVHDMSPNDVADEYTVYQKLPTFFYEYVPRKKQQ